MRGTFLSQDSMNREIYTKVCSAILISEDTKIVTNCVNDKCKVLWMNI
jgi:hypothetical protein